MKSPCDSASWFSRLIRSWSNLRIYSSLCWRLAIQASWDCGSVGPSLLSLSSIMVCLYSVISLFKLAIVFRCPSISYCMRSSILSIFSFMSSSKNFSLEKPSVTVRMRLELGERGICSSVKVTDDDFGRVSGYAVFYADLGSDGSLGPSFSSGIVSSELLIGAWTYLITSRMTSTGFSTIISLITSTGRSTIRSTKTSTGRSI